MKNKKDKQPEGGTVNTKYWPQRGGIYSLWTVMKELALTDSPHLGFRYAGKSGVIQTSHVTLEQLLSVPGLSETQWQYVRTTSEEIPVFSYWEQPGEFIDDFVDLKLRLDEPGCWWATPKGFPRKQEGE